VLGRSPQLELWIACNCPTCFVFSLVLSITFPSCLSVRASLKSVTTTALQQIVLHCSLLTDTGRLSRICESCPMRSKCTHEPENDYALLMVLSRCYIRRVQDNVSTNMSNSSRERYPPSSQRVYMYLIIGYPRGVCFGEPQDSYEACSIVCDYPDCLRSLPFIECSTALLVLVRSLPLCMCALSIPSLRKRTVSEPDIFSITNRILKPSQPTKVQCSYGCTLF
jgi:hypothetical protein